MQLFCYPWLKSKFFVFSNYEEMRYMQPFLCSLLCIKCLRNSLIIFKKKLGIFLTCLCMNLILKLIDFLGLFSTLGISKWQWAMRWYKRPGLIVCSPQVSITPELRTYRAAAVGVPSSDLCKRSVKVPFFSHSQPRGTP